MLIPLPETLLDRVDLAANPVPPRDAATIAVVRDGEQGLEAFLMRRRASLKFAAGMYVFPGGAVSELDAEVVDWVGPEPAYWAKRFSCDEAMAHRLVVAAIRETFEESGVLLAGADEHSVVADVSDPDLMRTRQMIEDEELSFAQFLADQGLVMRADLIEPWAHWITPVFEPRRFDTRFFVAKLPEGQFISQVSGEADDSLWAPLTEVLRRAEAKEAAMLPPTIQTCKELAYLTAGEVLETARQRSIHPIEPKAVFADGQWWLELEDEEHL